MVQTFFAAKIKAEGRVTFQFQDIFSSMADFRDVNAAMQPEWLRQVESLWLWEKGYFLYRQWEIKESFVAYLIVIVVEPATLKKRLLLLIDWRQKMTLFSTSLIIISLRHSAYITLPNSPKLCHSASHATCHSTNSCLLLPSVALDEPK